MLIPYHWYRKIPIPVWLNPISTCCSYNLTKSNICFYRYIFTLAFYQFISGLPIRLIQKKKAGGSFSRSEGVAHHLRAQKSATSHHCRSHTPFSFFFTLIVSSSTITPIFDAFAISQRTVGSPHTRFPTFSTMRRSVWSKSNSFSPPLTMFPSRWQAPPVFICTAGMAWTAWIISSG